jgi:hypothetical protein
LHSSGCKFWMRKFIAASRIAIILNPHSLWERLAGTKVLSRLTHRRFVARVFAKRCPPKLLF